MGKEKKEIEPKISKEDIKAQNKTLKNIFIGLGVIVFIIAVVILSINSAKHFEYNGVEFKVIQEGEIIFYNAVFPLYQGMTGKHIADYNIYLRNSPKKLEKVVFDGEVNLKPDTVINTTVNFNCDGDGVIAIANLAQVLETFGTNVIKNPEIGCDAPRNEYVFIQIREGNETRIEQFAPTCYNFYVNDCEILEVTEKFIVDLLVEAEKNRA